MTQKLTPLAQLIEDLELLRKPSFTAQEHKLLNDCITLCYAQFNEEKQMVIHTFAKAYLIGEDEINSMDAEKAATAYFNQNYKQ